MRINAALLTCILLASLLSATDYRFVRIDYPGAVLTVAMGINERGDVVGRYIDGGGTSHGFLRHNGSYADITFPNAAFTVPRAINSRGDVAGWFEFDDEVDHGFLLRDGHFTQIDFPGSFSTVPRGINDAGDISGNHDPCGECESGFILKDGAFYNVHIPNGYTSDIWIAQDNGRVMLGDAAMRPDGSLHSFLRTKPGSYQLIDFPGLQYPCTSARGINERGDIVGLYGIGQSVDDCYSGPPVIQLHGFLLRNGQYTAIDFPGGVNTGLFEINDDGTIVGRFEDKQGNVHGFMAVPLSGQ